MDHPHDQIFKSVFADPEQAAPLLRLAVSPEFAAALDWPHITALQTRLAAGDGTHAESDAHHFVPYRARKGGVVFLTEHKSTTDRFAVVQTYIYSGLTWRQFADLCKAGEELPELVTVLVHHGQQPWRGATSLRQLLPKPSPATPEQPTFTCLLLDLAHYSEAEILALDLLARGKLCTLYIQCLRFLTADEADAALDRWAPVFREAAATSQPEAFGIFHAYALEVTDLDRDRLAKRMAAILGPDAENHVMSTADKLRAEGRSLGRIEGKLEGKLEGETKGKLEGRAQLLFALLQKRFGPTAENASPRLRTATIEQLDRWALAILDARTLDDVFAAG